MPKHRAPDQQQQCEAIIAKVEKKFGTPLVYSNVPLVRAIVEALIEGPDDKPDHVA